MISAGTIVKHAKGFSDIQPIPPPKTSPTAHTKPITPKNETMNPIAPLKKMCNIIKGFVGTGITLPLVKKL